MPFSANDSVYVLPPPALPSVAVVGTRQYFPVRRIYCVGRNYAEHAREMGGDPSREAPFFFMKPADAIVADGGVVPYPAHTSDFHYEAELVVAIGGDGAHLTTEQAKAAVFGYAVGLDMTRRDLQAQLKKQGRPWCIAKGFDASAPIGAITPAAQAGDVQQAQIALHVNGQPRQSGSTAAMIWNIAEIITALSTAWELQAGDLIMTGTPAGVAAVQRGDVLDATVAGLAPLQVRLV